MEIRGATRAEMVEPTMAGLVSKSFRKWRSTYQIRTLQCQILQRVLMKYAWRVDETRVEKESTKRTFKTGSEMRRERDKQIVGECNSESSQGTCTVVPETPFTETNGTRISATQEKRRTPQKDNRHDHQMIEKGPTPFMVGKEREVNVDMDVKDQLVEGKREDLKPPNIDGAHFGDMEVGLNDINPISDNELNIRMAPEIWGVDQFGPPN
ncbi:hypothetical protein PIB30_050133 [Stylosanthes scabra]|uniref:Uncharacterized protein n=1 Tax=Stylosanthes scabra TaxID=79078 RepID=A0ABU6VH69_9FABA|nr:hypothetical protein [Stylosanthes scabra]